MNHLLVTSSLQCQGESLTGDQQPPVSGEPLTGDQQPPVSGESLTGNQQPPVSGEPLTGDQQPPVSGKPLTGDQKPVLEVTCSSQRLKGEKIEWCDVLPGTKSSNADSNVTKIKRIKNKNINSALGPINSEGTLCCA